MRQHVADIDLSAVELDGCHQSIFVASDVAHGEAIHHISTWKGLAKLSKTRKVRPPHNLKPAVEWCFAVGILFPEEPQRCPRDHVHQISISHVEIYVECEMTRPRPPCRPFPPGWPAHSRDTDAERGPRAGLRRMVRLAVSLHAAGDRAASCWGARYPTPAPAFATGKW